VAPPPPVWKEKRTKKLRKAAVDRRQLKVPPLPEGGVENSNATDNKLPLGVQEAVAVDMILAEEVAGVAKRWWWTEDATLVDDQQRAATSVGEVPLDVLAAGKVGLVQSNNDASNNLLADDLIH